MVKRAVVLHGTNGKISHNWQPWIARELRAHGVEVLQPELPGNDAPDKDVYNDFLFENQEWDFKDNLLVGHSSGATTILNMLMDDRCPEIKAAVMAASFLEMTDAIRQSDWFVEGQFDKTFPESGFDWEKISQKCPNFYFVHGKDDPVCPLSLAKEAAARTNGKMLIIPKGGHLSESAGIFELPGLIELLAADGIL